jgi:NAD(P)-dependent dehydrogenase (short-subunit alcohol dehydrogenase family)
MIEISNLPTFDAETDADRVIFGLGLDGRRAVVTGASSGLGLETARVLAGAGAAVTLAVRDRAAGERAAATIDRGRAAIEVAEVDLADLGSVDAFVDAWDRPLDILVANAGVMAVPELTRTAQGWELQLATNHLGHFALATGLHPHLAAVEEARIVALTSRGHFRSPIVFEDLNFTERPYEPFVAYGQSKTANVLFAVEASRRWGDEGILANAAFPGIVPETGLDRHLDPAVMEAKMSSGTVRAKSIGQGAATVVLAAASPALSGIGGLYLEDCRPAEVVDAITAETPGGVAAHAVDAGAARRLWEVSEQLLAEARR